MHHSIIIPHRDRLESLRLTLWGLGRSARRCKVTDYEVLVVDDGVVAETRRVARESQCYGVKVLTGPPPGRRQFNKPKLLNHGIEMARGKVLTFLDADMIVGEKFMRAPMALASPEAPTLLGYRVRHLSPDAVQQVHAHAGDLDALDLMIRSWTRSEPFSTWARATEQYWNPAPKPSIDQGKEPVPFGPHAFGNSQCSIRRDILGDLRFDESYECAGYEDISFVREVWRKHRPRYTGLILTDPDYALLHLFHPRPLEAGHPWNDPDANAANQERYHRTMTREDRDAIAQLVQLKERP